MKAHAVRQHVVDFIFPISLFFVFAASSFAVLLLAANIYSNTTRSSAESFETRTSLSYLTEKIRQNDTGASIRIGTFDGRDALILEALYGDTLYDTYIYEDDGVLRELFIQSGVEASASDGKEVMKLASLKMESVSDGLFKFTSTSSGGEVLSTVISTRSIIRD